MSLKGAKLVWTNKSDKQDKVIKLKNKKNFKFGYYMTNDFILENPNAKPVHCEIVADAFNRISIVNNSLKHPVSLNGFRVKTRRPLFHGNKIRIFDQEFIWQMPKNAKPKATQSQNAVTNTNNAVTPTKCNEMLLPAPSSEPWKIKNKRRIKERLSAHSTVHKKEEESSAESELDEKKKPPKSEFQISNLDRKTLTNQLRTRRTFDCVTPIKRVDSNASLIMFDVTLKGNKENPTKNRLELCKSSGTLVTSFSPQVQNNTPKSNFSFAYIKSNKNSPKSIYGTPKSVLSEVNNDNDNSSDLINFSTPRAKYTACNASMYLIDLTTPAKARTDNPTEKTPTKDNSTTKNLLLKSAMKSSNPNETNKSTKKVKIAFDVNSKHSQSPKENSAAKRIKLSNTPETKKSSFKKCLTLSCTKVLKESFDEDEKMTVDQSEENSIETIDETIDLDYISGTPTDMDSSVIEVTDDSISTDISNTSQIKTKSLSSTPQKSNATPQSLMKRAILSHARISRASKPVNASLSASKISTQRSVARRNSLHPSANSTNKMVKNSNLNKSVGDFKSNKFSNVNTLLSKTFATCESSDNVDDKSNKIKVLHRSALNTSLGKNLSFLQNRKSTNNRLASNRSVSKRHSCENTRLARSLMALQNPKTPNGSVNKSCAIASNTKTEAAQQVEEMNVEDSLLNETFTVEDTDEENCKSEQPSIEVKSSKLLNNTKTEEIKMNLNCSTKNPSLEVKTKTAIQNKVKSCPKTPIMEGIKEMISSPKIMSTPKMENIKHTMKTPRADRTPNLKGIKETLKTPKTTASNTPTLRAVKSLMKTPKKDDINLSGVKELLNTPKNNEIKPDGVRIMLKTPILSLKRLKSSELTPKNIFNETCDEDEEVDNIFKTPSAKNKMVAGKTCDSTITKKFLTTGSEIALQHVECSFSNEIDMVNSKFENSITNLEENCATPDTTFDKLIGKKLITKSYSNKKLTPPNPTDHVIPVNEEFCATTDIQEWVDNIPLPQENANSEKTELENFDDKMEIACGSKEILNNSINFSGIEKLNTTYGSDKSSNDEFRETDILNETFDMQEKNLTEMENVQEAKEQREMELAFENFDSEPNLNAMKSQTPDARKAKPKITRKTIGNKHILDESFDLQKAKEQREMELAFENFDNQPNENALKSQTPDARKTKPKITRKTMGNKQVLDESFDLQKAKEQREMELAFENFDNQPNVNTLKSQTPDARKAKPKITRKTIGNKHILDESFDLQKAKEQREIELAFENFDNQPNVNTLKSLTPDARKTKPKITRKTMGNKQVLDESFDLQEAKEQREMELAFENFDSEPNLNALKSQTPDARKTKPKITRKTMGNKQVLDESFDLQKAKEQREMELAFENFDSEPNLNALKSQTPDARKTKPKITRKTMGNKQVLDESFDLQEVKEQREMELAFENFDSEPNLNALKSQTPDARKTKPKITRKTMGNKQVLDESFDLQEAKEQREMELAFENFDSEPNLNALKSQTPDARKTKPKITRKTMGNKQVLDESFDLQEAKEQREMELAFENFDNQPNVNTLKSLTPDARKTKPKITRKTMGNKQVLDESFDLQEAKEQREMELAFENFDSEPNLNALKSQTPDARKTKPKITRKTMGNKQVLDESFDLQEAKEQREMELAFENFDSEPNLNALKSQTPDARKTKPKITRKTMGNKQVLDESFDLQKAKEQREMELAFENFDSEPNLNALKSQTPDARKTKPKITRKTMGNKQVLDESFDLQEAKEQREMELAFENFDSEPNLNALKSQTPDASKTKPKIKRKTMGNKQVLDQSFDLQKAKEQREMELAFENFDNQPNVNALKSQTPDASKTKPKIKRKTMGNKQVLDQSFDLQKAKEQREMELAFENFDSEPNLNALKSQTPDASKTKPKITRKTMGNKQVLDESFDLQKAKEQREMELAFENFDSEPNLNALKSQTPDARREKSKITRKTMGNKQVLYESFDLQEAREQRETELAFENFNKEPKLIITKSLTPNSSKKKSKFARKSEGHGETLNKSFELLALQIKEDQRKPKMSKKSKRKGKDASKDDSESNELIKEKPKKTRNRRDKTRVAKKEGKVTKSDETIELMETQQETLTSGELTSTPLRNQKSISFDDRSYNSAELSSNTKNDIQSDEKSEPASLTVENPVENTLKRSSRRKIATRKMIEVDHLKKPTRRNTNKKESKITTTESAGVSVRVLKKMQQNEANEENVEVPIVENAFEVTENITEKTPHYKIFDVSIKVNEKTEQNSDPETCESSTETERITSNAVEVKPTRGRKQNNRESPLKDKNLLLNNDDEHEEDVKPRTRRGRKPLNKAIEKESEQQTNIKPGRTTRNKMKNNIETITVEIKEEIATEEESIPTAELDEEKSNTEETMLKEKRTRGRGKIKKEPENSFKDSATVDAENSNIDSITSQDENVSDIILPRQRRGRKLRAEVEKVEHETEEKDAQNNGAKEMPKRRGRAKKNAMEETDTQTTDAVKTELNEQQQEDKVPSNISDSDQKTPQKGRGRPKKNINKELEVEINSSISIEPAFKTPSSVAPKARALRRLRSNSTCTPIILDDSVATCTPIILDDSVANSENLESNNDVSINKKLLTISPFALPRRRLRSNSVDPSSQLADSLVSGANEIKVEPVKRITRRGKKDTPMDSDKENGNAEVKETENQIIEDKSTTKVTRNVRTNKRKLLDTIDLSNDSDSDMHIVEKRVTRRKK